MLHEQWGLPGPGLPVGAQLRQLLPLRQGLRLTPVLPVAGVGPCQLPLLLLGEEPARLQRQLPGPGLAVLLKHMQLLHRPSWRQLLAAGQHQQAPLLHLRQRCLQGCSLLLLPLPPTLMPGCCWQLLLAVGTLHHQAHQCLHCVALQRLQ